MLKGLRQCVPGYFEGEGGKWSGWAIGATIEIRYSQEIVTCLTTHTFIGQRGYYSTRKVQAREEHTGLHRMRWV